MVRSGARRWLRLISVVGLLIWAGFLWNFAVELRMLSVVWPPVLAVLTGTGFSLAVVYLGYRLGQEDWIDGPAARRIVGWGLGGLVVVTVLQVITITIRRAEGRTLGEPQLDVLLGLSGGLLIGVLVGYLYEQARRDARRARRARDALGFLNQTLRHECLNGLNIVHGNAQLATEHVDDEDVKTRLSTIVTRCSDMTAMIQDIRAFAGTVAGEVELETVQLSRILRRRVNLARKTYPTAEISLETPPDDELDVRANETIAHVIENLLQNAIEHNDGAVPEVTVAADRTDDAVTVAIADNGPGIPPSKREEVFSPDLERGHRFGLYLVKQLVDSYGGEITISDNDPEGTVVTVEVPRATGGSNSSPSRATQRASGGSSA